MRVWRPKSLAAAAGVNQGAAAATHPPVITCVPAHSEFPEGVESFADFTNHLVVHAVYKFLDRVEPGIRLKNRLPNGAAARQRYCKALGKKIEVRAHPRGGGRLVHSGVLQGLALPQRPRQVAAAG